MKIEYLLVSSVAEQVTKMLVVLMGLITASLNSGKSRFEIECQRRKGGREGGVMRK